MPPGRPFLLPVRLEECEVPPQLEKVQYLDYFAAGGPRKVPGRHL